jgi:transcriptional regulator with XRE-family HTH domain
MPRRSPTVRRRRLGIELRRLREAAELTIDQAATRLEFSTAKLSRIENAQVAVSPHDVRGMLDVYGAEEQIRGRLMQIAREARQKGWWQPNFADLPVTELVGLETEAATLRQYAGLVVPGLLQIPEYATAVVRAARLDLKSRPEEIDREVQLRIARQDILTQADGPSTWIVLDEAALRRKVGSRDVMRKQLDHLVEAASQRNLTLQVLPYESGAHPGLAGAFTIIGFRDRADPDVIYIEISPTGDLYLEDQQTTRTYVAMFDHIRAAALSPTESAEFLARAAREQ